jgi:hypothetical protein
MLPVCFVSDPPGLYPGHTSTRTPVQLGYYFAADLKWL